MKEKVNEVSSINVILDDIGQTKNVSELVCRFETEVQTHKKISYQHFKY